MATYSVVSGHNNWHSAALAQKGQEILLAIEWQVADLEHLAAAFTG
jgi:hypothetical protein